MAKIIVIGGIESTYTNAQILHELGNEIVMFYTRGPESPGWEGVDMIDASQYPFMESTPITTVNGFINDHIPQMRTLEPDFIYSLGWQQMYAQEMLDICPIIGFHESLLPRGAGPTPIANAVLHGESQTGVTMFLLDPGMDTGDIIFQLAGKLDPRKATSTALYEEAMALEADMLRALAPMINEGIIPRIKQNSSDRKCYQKIDWEAWPAEHVERARTYPYA